MDASVLYLARHGETDWNREQRWQGQTDTELNALGREQAALLADRLKGCAIARIHASDLRRARETAEIAARHLGLGRVVSDPDLRERNFGVFEGLTFTECAARFPEAWPRYRADRIRPEGAESDQALIARISRGVGRAIEGIGIALVVTHGGALRAFLRAAGVGSANHDDFALPNGSLLRMDVKLRHGTLDIRQCQPVG